MEQLGVRMERTIRRHEDEKDAHKLMETGGREGHELLLL